MESITKQLAETRLQTKEWSNVVKLTRDIDQSVLNQYVADLGEVFTAANAHDGINHSYRYHLPSLAEHSRLDTDMVFLALNEGQVIGLMIGFNDDGVVDVTSIVHPKFRRQGVFKALLKALREVVGESDILSFEICNQSTSGIECAQHLGLLCPEKNKIDYYMSCKKLTTPNKPLPTITFKIGLESDAHLAARIYEEDAKHNSEEEEYNAQVGMEDYIEDLKKEREYRFYFNEENDLVGMIEYVSRNDAEPPYIMNFFVRPKYRGKSFGEAILRNAVSYWLDERNRSPVELETPREIASLLYKKCGFEVTQSYNSWCFKHQYSIEPSE